MFWDFDRYEIANIHTAEGGGGGANIAESKTRFSLQMRVPRYTYVHIVTKSLCISTQLYIRCITPKRVHNIFASRIYPLCWSVWRTRFKGERGEEEEEDEHHEEEEEDEKEEEEEVVENPISRRSVSKYHESRVYPTLRYSRGALVVRTRTFGTKSFFIVYVLPWSEHR